MKTLRKITCLLLILVLVFSMAACGAKEGEEGEEATQGGNEQSGQNNNSDSEGNTGSGAKIEIGFSNPAPPSHPQNVAFNWMADELAARSNGNITMTVYPNGNAGTIMETFQMCVDGTLQMTAGSLSTLANYDPGMAFVDMPYFWTSIEAMIACMEVYGQELTQNLCDLGVVALGFGDNDYYDFMSTKKPIYEPSDMVGLNFHCQENDITIRFTEALGGNPVVISSTEVWTGLQTGILDVHSMGSIISYSGSYYDVSKYYTTTHHCCRVEYIFANEAWWNGLDERDRNLISEVFDEMLIMMNERCAKMRETAISNMETEHGVTIIHPTEESLAEFEEIGRSIWPEFKDKINYDLMIEMYEWMENWEAENAAKT